MQYAGKIIARLCVIPFCKKPQARMHTRCDEHVALDRTFANTERARRLSAGLCVHPGCMDTPNAGATRCEVHRVYHNTHKRRS